MRIARFICSLFLAVGLLAIPAQSKAQVAVGISVRVGPPILPVYVQPICPGPGYIWVPGYWAYGDEDYYWVPGTWVEPPEVGLLWTPGYWGWGDGAYLWYPGYWGPEVGFYGGINYGFGYTGVGFFGGYWRGGTYYYNRAVTNVDATVVHNTYNTTVINNTTNRVSFNGGRGGTAARPSSHELEAARQRHFEMTSEQTQHQQAARANRTLLASVNHGRPEIAAIPRPGQFNGRGAVKSGRPETSNRSFENPRDANRSGNTPSTNGRTLENRPGESRKETNRPGRPPENNGRTFEDRPPSSRPSDTSRVNPGLEQKHQREAEKMRQQQDAERQKVQQRHVQEQQKLEQRRADQQQRDQLQRRQQRQQDQLQQKHAQQTQKLQEHQQREVQRDQPNPKPPKNGRSPEHQ